jgi:hypothetical protein
MIDQGDPNNDNSDQESSVGSSPLTKQSQAKNKRLEAIRRNIKGDSS